MNMFEIILFCIGLWFIIFSFISHTKNFKSSFIFKVIPFFCGCYCIFYSLMNNGIININL